MVITKNVKVLAVLTILFVITALSLTIYTNLNSNVSHERPHEGIPINDTIFAN